jgi:hypothetical protein
MFRRIGVEDRGDMAMKRKCAEQIAEFTGQDLPEEFMAFIRVLENEKPEQVEEYLEKEPGICEKKDFMGRGPLHWVADYPYWVEEMKTSKVFPTIRFQNYVGLKPQLVHQLFVLFKKPDFL